MTAVKVRLAAAAVGKPEIKISALRLEMGVTRQVTTAAGVGTLIMTS
jgi:hypothetical protein